MSAQPASVTVHSPHDGFGQPQPYTPLDDGLSSALSVVARDAQSSGSDDASARWSDIKGLSFDARADFRTGLLRLQKRLDFQVGELKAKRAKMRGTVDTKAWDFAMKEMGDSRSYLDSLLHAQDDTSMDTWSQYKDRVGKAWVRSQDAYDKVRTSTTT